MYGQANLKVQTNRIIQGIKYFGWRQGNLGDPYTGFCVMGSQRMMCMGMLIGPWITAFSDWLVSTGQVPKPHEDMSKPTIIAYWNDSPGMNEEQILLTLEKFKEEL